MSKGKKTNWVTLLGKAKIAKDTIKFIPTIIGEGPNKGQTAATLIKSNYDFENGIISLKAKLFDSENQVQIGLNHGLGNEIYVGIGPGITTFSISVFSSQGQKWESLASAGFGERPPANEDIEVEVRVSGSKIDLRINQVSVCSANYKVLPCQVALLMNGKKETLIKQFKVSAQKPTAFVVMQFTEAFNALYTEVIKPTCEKFGLTCIRADDMYTNDLILLDITRSIQECFVLIADVTPDNPNVFYEVGYAHGMGKTTILLSDRKRGNLPFDISGFRTLFYDNTIGGKTAIEERLSKHLRGITNK